ncbi:cyclic nucleotide-binding domain-containing protein 2-like [Elysia marginata]|uniref:Cyclic nucleotide-binding domain-containing protein 2-like n=1 Tax=Elysia marginata TaxID=1093978 RepID=A0AAV4HWL9_9GAST|nr:cyclic nucleotide-binding domain-containing protein 2-like [Elysia marginata]
MTFSKLAEQRQKREEIPTSTQYSLCEKDSHGARVADNEREQEKEMEIFENEDAYRTNAEEDIEMEPSIMRVEVTHRKISNLNGTSSEKSNEQSTSDRLDTDQTKDNHTPHSSSASDSDTEPDEPAVLPVKETGLNKQRSVETLQVQERQVSDLLSSEDEDVLLHRPDFYSILSEEDSFEWTFRNEKFSDLDIKFIPRVEEHWAEGKAKSSLKGNASVTPEAKPENTKKPKTPQDLGQSSEDKKEKNFHTENLQETKSPALSLNLEKLKQKSEGENLSKVINIKQNSSKTEHKKQVTINFRPIVQNEDYKNTPRHNFNSSHIVNKPSMPGNESNSNSVERQWTKQYRTPFVRENVVFFQSSPTLTYKKTKLKFLENKSNDHASMSADFEKSKDDNLMWSSKARLGVEIHNSMKHKKPEMSIDKADELIRRRNAYRKLCKLDDVEAKFISSSTSETMPPLTSFSTKINAPAGSRRGSNPQILLSSSLDSSVNKVHFTPCSEDVSHIAESKLPEAEKPTGQRRSARDVIQWLFEGRLSEASKLRRRRSSKDLGQPWRNLKGAMSKPGPLRNWISLPSSRKSGSSQTSFTDRSEKPLTALQYFRRWARMVCLMLRAVGLKPKKPVTTNLDFLSWTVVYDEVLGISRLNYDSGTLTFDPEAYKANRELIIRPDVREILRLSAEERTDAQVYTAMKCLQHVVPAFSEFPVRVQQSMLKVCRHEEFESGRVIIRQGHRAENFYFIVSGSAVVTVMDSGENHVHTANLLGKGSSFGDLAFLNMAKRSATVTCRDTVEVICIERDDFINIFLRGVQGKEPAHFTFLREVDLLKGWPVSALPQDNPRICAYTYVRRGVILSHDSATCDWIVVVVSGTCTIIKAMNDPGQKAASLAQRPSSRAIRKGSSGPSSRRGSASPSSQRGSASSFSRRQSASPSSRRTLRDSMCSPASSTSSYHDNGVENSNSNLLASKQKGKRSVRFADEAPKDTQHKEDTPRTKRNSLTNRKTEENRKMRHQLVLSDLNLDINSKNSSRSLSRGKLEAGLAQERHLAQIEKIFTKKHVLPAIRKAAQNLPPTVILPYANVHDRPALTLRRGSDAQNASILRPHRLSTGVQPPALPQVFVQGPDEGDDEEVVKEPAKKVAPSEEKVFIEVAHLEEGDVFGLEHVLLGNISDVTSCSLVSAGAEVVLISKKFFQKHLTEETAKLIREKIRPLPSEASLKAQLKAQLSWQAFKAELFTRHAQGQQNATRPGTTSRHPQITRQSGVDRGGGYRTASQMS